MILKSEAKIGYSDTINSKCIVYQLLWDVVFSENANNPLTRHFAYLCEYVCACDY